MNESITAAGRAAILAMLAEYEAGFPAERAVAARIRRLVVRHDDCLLRTCLPGHVTASAWIIAHDRRRFLLTHHAKLDRWLQLGGHVDGDSDLARSALREAREESRMDRFETFSRDGRPVAIDLDVHPIPARGAESAHEHHDFRFLLVAAPGQEPRASAESREVRWFEPHELESVTREESVLRLARKAKILLEADHATDA